MENIKPQSTLIKSNEMLLKENGEWLHFSRPRQVVIAEKLADILPALREIEQLIQIHNQYAAGFLSYEAASAFGPEIQTRAVKFPQKGQRPKPEDEAQQDGFPYVWFGIYPKPRPVLLPHPTKPKETLNWRPTVDRETYQAAIARIKDHIAEGRTYQVNYTMQ